MRRWHRPGNRSLGFHVGRLGKGTRRGMTEHLQRTGNPSTTAKGQSCLGGTLVKRRPSQVTDLDTRHPPGIYWRWGRWETPTSERRMQVAGRVVRAIRRVDAEDDGGVVPAVATNQRKRSTPRSRRQYRARCWGAGVATSSTGACQCPTRIRPSAVGLAARTQNPTCACRSVVERGSDSSPRRSSSLSSAREPVDEEAADLVGEGLLYAPRYADEEAADLVGEGLLYAPRYADAGRGGSWSVPGCLSVRR